MNAAITLLDPAGVKVITAVAVYKLNDSCNGRCCNRSETG